jgi:hypothetical protein
VPQPQSILELLGENRRLKMTVNLMAMEVAKAKVNNTTSNAHCTIMTQAVTTAKANLDHQKRTTRQAVKTSACYVAHPAIEDEWNASQLEKAQHAKEATEMEAKKATEEALRTARMLRSESTPTFSSSSYTYSAPDTWDTPPPSPTVVSEFPDLVPTHPLDILPRVAPEPFSLESLMRS